MGDNAEQTPSPAKAVVVTMSKFRLPASEGEGPNDWDLEDEDPPGRSSWRDLRFAPALGRRVAAELSPLVAPGTAHLPDLDSKSLRARMDDVLAAVKGGDRMVVHILSHGFLDGDRESDLLIAATDTLHPEHDDVRETAFAVRQFLIDADRKSGHLLLLLDVCHGGGALDWTTRIKYTKRRTYVIAACPPDEQAWSGRFSEAVCEVLSGVVRGHKGIDPRQRFVRLTWFRDELHRTLIDLCKKANLPEQEVIYSKLEGPSTEFLLNPWFREDRADVYELDNYWRLQDFMAGVHPALDIGHYLSKASGRHDVDPADGVSLFSGREDQLVKVADWLSDGAEHGTLCVVTGSPGVGKSALLGAVVCCTQTQLAKVMHSTLVQQISPSARPEQRPLVAAVHARQMTLADTMDSIGAQLDLEQPTGGWSSQQLVSAVASLPDEPLIVVDGLDEATDSVQITVELLLPLAEQVFPDGPRRRACQLLVGVRPHWDQLPQLAATVFGGSQLLVDLDAADRRQLQQDLETYVERLLYETDTYASERKLRSRIARTVAERVVGSSHGGEFLKAQMAARSLAQAAPHTEDAADAAVAEMPMTFASLLEGQLTDERTHPWARRVMTALAFAKGSGMPAHLLPQVAAALPPACDAPGREDVDAVLTGMSFYLRQDVDTSYGTTLYRLFHQELVDHLRSSARKLPDPQALQDTGDAS
ncbi:AAA family ATPase [Streptomyces hyaluromycini]|uniref:AAA family ATPase n=1 Tax=Streptomyces hyaluromycini TaxID=1377993 RepID=A0ABV1WWY9_9ACTN